MKPPRAAPRCPKCRRLGLLTDCTDRIHHGEGPPMIEVTDTSEVELEVTLTFPVPVTSTIDVGPREMATFMRDFWVDNPEDLISVVTHSIGEDFDLQVKPFSEP